MNLNCIKAHKVLLFALVILCTPLAAIALVPKPGLLSRAAVVIDVTTNKLLYAKNPNLRLPIASLTKLMTASVVLDSKRSLLKPLRVTSDDVDRIKWSRSRLPVKSLMLRGTLLHIALMSSENRAAFALSRNYTGGRHNFVRAMNRKAKSLRMTRTHFVDPTGLSPGNVSTARDLSHLALAAYRYSAIRRYSTDKQQLVFGGEGPLLYPNSDPLVRDRTWQVKLQKIGFTNEAGHCLIVMAPVRGHLILTVPLGAPNAHAHFQDAIDLRRWVDHRLA